MRHRNRDIVGISPFAPKNRSKTGKRTRFWRTATHEFGGGTTYEATEYLRKEQVFLLQRFFDFLETEKEHGLLVMDQVEREEDRRFVSRLERYFTRTETGRYRTAWIVPVPLFVSSDLTYPVQAADLAIYALNWGFRLPTRGMDAGTRSEIADEFGPWINRLQFRGDSYREGAVYAEYGIIYVPDPYTRR